MIFIYRLFYSLAKWIVLILKPVLSENLQRWVALRSTGFEKQHDFKNTYWFHASSGEIEYCKSVIRLLRKQKPNCQIIVTYSSPSAEKLFKNIKAFVDQIIPLCWDEPKQVNRFLDYINPSVLIFSRTDLWPELITQAKKRSVTVGVISYNPSPSALLGFLLPKLDFISCLNPDISVKLQTALNLKNVTVDGDPRFDQVFFRLAQPPVLKIECDAKLMVWGSTWHEDEEVFIKSLPSLKALGLKFVLSPHEVAVANIKRLEQILKSHKLSFQTLSAEPDEQNITLKADVLIIDKIGYLADVYRFASLAFVGGSFKEKIHSVMEPLCCGLTVLTGPFYKNNPEAVTYHNRFVFSANNPDDVAELAARFVNEKQPEILSEMQKNLNASQKVLRLISDIPLKN